MKRAFLLSLTLVSGVSSAVHSHFRQWYPQFGPIFQRALNNNCSDLFDTYVRDLSPPCSTPAQAECISGNIVTCLLDNVPESVKANSATAAVLLGLLPTTLGLVGSSTAETGLLSLRKPLLAILLATGAPAISPIRTFEYRSPTDLLQLKPDSSSLVISTRRASIVLGVLEYLLAAAATANLAHTSWELSIKSVCSFSPDTDYQPLLYAFLAVSIHMAGAATVAARASLAGSTPEKMGLFGLLRTELQLREYSADGGLNLMVRKESFFFLLGSWFTSTLTICHIIYGTVVFSSILFISAQDALAVVGRFLASTMVCRVIVMVEISRMRHSHQRAVLETAEQHRDISDRDEMIVPP